MARAARYAVVQASVAGLLTAAAVACATMQEPPGGPPDPDPPVLIGVTPDSGSLNDGFDEHVSFDFDEIIAEQGIENLILVSPRHQEIDVSWKRRRITVRPKDGWRDSVAYQVTLLPGLTDLRNNRLESGNTLVFSTGGEIPQTRVTGRIVDWEAGRIGARALVEAIRMPDSLTYIGDADSVGVFELAALPPGTYVLFGTIDQNNNRERGARESFDSVTVRLDSTVTYDLWAFPHDTIGPRITSVQQLDSLAVSVVFNQPIRPDSAPPTSVQVSLLPDTVPVAVDTVLWPAAFDSIQSLLRDSIAEAVRDSVLAADTTTADSTAAVADSAAAAPLAPLGPGAPGRPDPDAGADTTEVSASEQLLAQRPPLIPSIVIVLAEPLQPGARYLIETTMINLLDVSETSVRPLVIPEAPPDST